MRVRRSDLPKCGSTRVLDVGVNMIENVLSPCRIFQTLVELYEYSPQAGLVKVPLQLCDHHCGGPAAAC